MSNSPSPRKKSTRYDLKPKEKPVYPTIQFHVEGESLAKRDWRPNGKSSMSISKSPNNTKAEREGSHFIEGTREVDDSFTRTSPRRKRTPGPIHLGGGAVGEGEKQLAAAGYRVHWGKWRGWPYDYWSCCKSSQTHCTEPNSSLKVMYKEKVKITKVLII
jgi:hypothetical protein